MINNKKGNKGISLIVLVITIVVVIILATAVILTITQGGIVDNAKKAKFMNDFRSVEEGVDIYSLSKIDVSNPSNYILPLEGKLSLSDKQNISDKVPTLKTKIEELNPGKTINDIDLYWINEPEIGANNIPANKADKGYIIDIATNQIYDYYGEYFYGLRWHTLDSGVSENPPVIVPKTEETWDGWIKLTLFYPSNSTARQWRLGTPGELRYDPILMWQDYTGPITVPLDRVKDVWIKYKINGQDVIIPPAGTLLVDIEPDKTGSTLVDKVNVTIKYDDSATIKEYRIGNSGWITYTGPFDVTENCVIEARAKKTESIYNTDGSLLMTRDVIGRDMVYIGNIGVTESDLPAPTMTRLDPQNINEKARVKVTYPANADKKIYKINYGDEQNYTTEISVQSYGTYVIAYYYDSTGKRSKAIAIKINDTTGGVEPIPPEPPPVLPPNPPIPPIPPPDPDPTKVAPAAPTIAVSPTALTTEVQLTVTAPATADKVYVKLGRYGNYQLYTGAITVRQNMEVYAYYITYTGDRSAIGYGVVSNIKQANKPYVYIDANPYPWSGSYGASKVTITVKYSDTTSIEYSEDGITYKPYTAPFDVTKNERIYARGTNANGVTETYLDITNIGAIVPPVPKQLLAVNINVNPEPILSVAKVASASVSIEYDSKATEKYYKIGVYGALKTYTGPFTVNSSCTIYAYAKGTNAEGTAAKTIDNISSGISEPLISANPNNSTQSSKVTISIQYDKSATIKRYSLNGGALTDYGTTFDVTNNGTVVYAYSENALGQKSESTYTIENIVPQPPTLLLDKGDYYILKLNYPEGSKSREYKWKVDGTWTSYKQAGILLIKPQFKDKLIQNGTLVKIQDENGNLVTFTGDYYLIDIPINEISENIFMRWDRVTPAAPQIIINPTDAARQVTATIIYNDTLIKKQYRVVKPGETPGVWQDYTGPITITKNNSIVYAKGMDEAEVWSLEGVKKITNIDEVPPVIKVTADLTTPGQKIAIKVDVTDDVAVGKVKWASGLQGESYFKTGGTEIANNSIVNITTNGYYTFYAEDKVGNTQVYTLNVTNVDLTPPVIAISVNPENTVGLNTNVTVDYGDSIASSKQYKVGTSNATWTNYTGGFAISSYTVLANNWQNGDGTVTIYAKGKDSAGNEITVQKKVLSLDLDMPATPIINASAGYPVLTAYGIIYDSTTTIIYDSRTDIDNYYSIDNGVSWQVYTGSFNIVSGTVIAKSVKKNTGLEVVKNQSIATPADALKPQAYDGSDTTYVMPMADLKAKIDSSLYGKKLRIKWYQSNSTRIVRIRFLDSNNNEISQTAGNDGDNDQIILVPTGSKTIKFTSDYPSEAGNPADKVYEVQVSNEPTFTATNVYPLIHADPTKIDTIPHQNVTITYFTTSAQRLYRIGTTGNWLNYNDQAVRVNQGQTIYAKGIDQYGKETRVVSSYTANIIDAVKQEAFDGSTTTYTSPVANIYAQIDSSMNGGSIRVVWYQANSTRIVRIRFLDSNNNEISQVVGVDGNNDQVMNIPSGSKYIKFTSDYPSEAGNPADKIYEIQVANEPKITAANGYPLLNADITQCIKIPYQNVTINYFGTSVQKLYRIGATGTWLNYQGIPVKVDQNQIIYAKGIDQYGNETRITSSYTSNVSDSVKQEAFDGNTSTYSLPVSGVYTQLDSSMSGRTIRVVWYQENTTRLVRIRFLNQNYTEISQVTGVDGTNDRIIVVPTGSKYIKFTSDYVSEGVSAYDKIYEIQIANEPVFTATNGYPLLHADPAQCIKTPYQDMTISYFGTSVQKLYQVGSTTGTWLNYQNVPIRVYQGQTIYAKGIDMYGNNTRITSSYSPNVADAVKPEAFDGNTSTFVSPVANIFAQVDSSMYGKTIKVRWYQENTTRLVRVRFLDQNYTEINQVTGVNGINDKTMTVPSGCKYIKFTTDWAGEAGNPYNKLYEIVIM